MQELMDYKNVQITSATITNKTPHFHSNSCSYDLNLT